MVTAKKGHVLGLDCFYRTDDEDDSVSSSGSDATDSAPPPPPPPPLPQEDDVVVDDEVGGAAADGPFPPLPTTAPPPEFANDPMPPPPPPPLPENEDHSRALRNAEVNDDDDETPELTGTVTLGNGQTVGLVTKQKHYRPAEITRLWLGYIIIQWQLGLLRMKRSFICAGP